MTTDTRRQPSRNAGRTSCSPTPGGRARGHYQLRPPDSERQRTAPGQPRDHHRRRGKAHHSGAGRSRGGPDGPGPAHRLPNRPRGVPGRQRVRHLRAGETARLRHGDSVPAHRQAGRGAEEGALRRLGNPRVLAVRRDRGVPRHTAGRTPAGTRAIRDHHHRDRGGWNTAGPQRRAQPLHPGVLLSARKCVTAPTPS